MMAKRRLLAIAATLVAVLIVGLAVAERRVRATNGALPVLWNLPRFSFVDQHGATVSDRSLRGHVLIADFIFTRCTAVCPLTTAKMTLLRRSIRRQDVRFVSFSVDPEYDKPERLLAYAERWKGDARWELLATTPGGLHDVAAGMKVTVARSDDPENPIVHSSLFFLIDGEGRVRGVYDSDDDAALRRLASEADALERTPASGTPETGAVRGMELFQSAGCAGCHDDRRVAPSLAGLSGRLVALQGGSTVVADAAYIRRSILDPGVQIAPGFSVSMPAYRGQLTEAQVDDLVRYVESLPAAPSASAPASAVVTERAIDPVCGMSVVASSASPHVVRGGKTYWFCSEPCRDRFVARSMQGIK